MTFNLNDLPEALPKITPIDKLMNIITKDKKYMNSCKSANDTISYFIQGSNNLLDKIKLLPYDMDLNDMDLNDILNHLNKILKNNYDTCEICMENIEGCIYVCEQCTKFTCCSCTASMKQVSNICTRCQNENICPSTQFMITTFTCPYCRYDTKYDLKIIKLSDSPNVLQISIINPFAEKFAKVMNEIRERYETLSYPDIITFNHPNQCCVYHYSVDEECFEDDDRNCPYVPLDEYHYSDKLENPNDIVAPEEFIIYIGYPLEMGIYKHIRSDSPFTRIEIANLICKLYQEIYQEEESCIQDDSFIPIGERYIVINRNAMNKVYGIYLDIENLLLLNIKKNKYNVNGIPVYKLTIDT